MIISLVFFWKKKRILNFKNDLLIFYLLFHILIDNNTHSTYIHCRNVTYSCQKQEDQLN